MKILDRYILTSFIQTFLSVFIILFFIFILQGIWLFIDQLAGKDLEFFVIVKFLGFYSPTIVPLVLPLSILLASIMTFGSFAENYEFAAMKSSGISLGRAMRSLMIFIVLLSIVAFFFANNVIPQAQYRFTNLRANIMQRKPAMAIVEGQFNSMGSFNIRVEKKHGENGEQLEGITIHRRKFNPGASNAGTMIIRAKNGLLKSSEKSNLLQLELYDGYYYEDIDNNNDVAAREKMPFAKSKFSRHLMNIDLTALNSQSTDDDQQVVHTNNMLNISELNYTLDSLQSNYNKEVKSTADNLVVRPSSIFIKVPRLNLPDSVKTVKEIVPNNLLSILKEDEKARVLDLASNNESSTDYVVTSGITGLQEKIKNINGHWLALYDKFVIAYACLMMFFIGAPLGAIIRKGGLGLPIVFAVLIFIIFHFINTFGKKVAQEDGITPFMGAWMSSFVLTPFAVLFTYRATNDMNLTIDMDWLTVPIVKLFSKRQKAKQPIFNIAAFSPVQDDEWFALQQLETDVLIAEARTTRQHKRTEIYRKKVLKTLDARGITQDELKEEGNLYDVNYLNLELLEDRFKVHATAAVVLNIIGIILALKLKTKPVLLVPALVVLFGMYTFIISSARCLRDINKITHKNYGLPFIIVVLLGFPFYFILYFINRRAVNNALTHYTT